MDESIHRVWLDKGFKPLVFKPFIINLPKTVARKH